MERIIRIKELVQILGVSRSTIYRLRNKTGETEFIPFIQLGPRSVGVFESDLEKWLGERKLVTQRKNSAHTGHTDSSPGEQPEHKTHILGEQK